MIWSLSFSVQNQTSSSMQTPTDVTAPQSPPTFGMHAPTSHGHPSGHVPHDPPHPSAPHSLKSSEPACPHWGMQSGAGMQVCFPVKGSYAHT